MVRMGKYGDLNPSATLRQEPHTNANSKNITTGNAVANHSTGNADCNIVDINAIGEITKTDQNSAKRALYPLPSPPNTLETMRDTEARP